MGGIVHFSLPARLAGDPEGLPFAKVAGDEPGAETIDLQSSQELGQRANLPPMIDFLFTGSSQSEARLLFDPTLDTDYHSKVSIPVDGQEQRQQQQGQLQPHSGALWNMGQTK